MNFNTFDIYTDASIDLTKKVGCAGALVVNRKTNEIINEIFALRYNATNNLCEIIAIWLGIYQAIGLLNTEHEAFHVNLFSDSQISLFGMREWIPGWIRNRKGEAMISSSGVVANQEWFRDAYHAILGSGLKIKFFHQKGHVSTDSPKHLYIAEKTFRTSNINSLHMIGLSAQTISTYNNKVDNDTRQIVQAVCDMGMDPRTMNNVLLNYGPTMMFDFHDSEIEIYKSQIRGGLNYPRFFNGGI